MSNLFDHPEFDQHQQVVFCNDAGTGLRAIVSIHDTTLGPSLGGCRMYPYKSEADALNDVLRLSRGMTYKSAIAGLPLGGGKSVIIGDPHDGKKPELFRAMGRFIESLGGNYVTAEDSGTNQQDMAWIRESTSFVAGVKGDPSPYTARGVFQGISAAIKHRYGRETLDGIRVSIQGAGNVGAGVAALLHEAGARLWISDTCEENAARAAADFGAKVVEPEGIFDVEVDVFSPCAMGAILDEATIGRLRASVVAGAANNQLSTPACGSLLKRRGILYAPDYVINAGGVIAVWYEYSAKNTQTLTAEVDRIYTTLMEIFEQSEAQRQPTSDIADQLAMLRIEKKKRQPVPQRIAV